MTFVDTVFQNELIFVDGNAYRGCKFLECHLSFGGTAAVDFDDCLFRQCNWNFEGAALTTLGFLSALARGARKDSDFDLFDELVAALRHGLVIGDVAVARRVSEPEPVAR